MDWKQDLTNLSRMVRIPLLNNFASKPLISSVPHTQSMTNVRYKKTFNGEDTNNTNDSIKQEVPTLYSLNFHLNPLVGKVSVVLIID